MIKAFLLGGVGTVVGFFVLAFCTVALGGQAWINPCSGAALFCVGGGIGLIFRAVYLAGRKSAGR